MSDNTLMIHRTTATTPEPTPLAPHEEAASLVTGERNDAYDHPFDNFQRTANIWNGILYDRLSTPITPEDVALMMLGVKVAREAYKHKGDNLVDAHGYLMTLQMVLDRRAEISEG